MRHHEKKSIFEYNDYREFLKDAFVFQKAHNRKFSLRYFSKMAGFSSHNFLKLVISGQSNLSRKSIDKVIKGFKLNGEEGRFFKNLVLFNQSVTTKEKEHYAQELVRSRAYKKMHPLHESQFNYYAKWYCVPIRELIGTNGFKENPEWIANQIVPAITPAEAKAAIEDLVKLDLIRRDSSGKLVQSSAIVATADEVISTSVTQFHKKMLKLAAESFDRVPRQKRDISSITLGITEPAAKEIKEIIQKFRMEVAQVAARHEGSDRVYQLNLQLFPLVLGPAEENQ